MYPLSSLPSRDSKSFESPFSLSFSPLPLDLTRRGRRRRQAWSPQPDADVPVLALVGPVTGRVRRRWSEVKQPPSSADLHRRGWRLSVYSGGSEVEGPWSLLITGVRRGGGHGDAEASGAAATRDGFFTAGTSSGGTPASAPTPAVVNVPGVLNDHGLPWRLSIEAASCTSRPAPHLLYYVDLDQ